MPTDRTAALRNAETLLRQGQAKDALEEFVQIADGMRAEGFLPAAGAVYKRVLKIDPANEHALIYFADVSASQGLLADARQALMAVARNRGAIGDRRSVAEITIRLSMLDPSDVEARIAGMRARLETATADAALTDCRTLVSDLIEQGRPDEVSQVLDAAVALNIVGDAQAAAMLEPLLTLATVHAPAITRLVDVAARAGLHDLVTRAKAMLVDAHLAQGAGAEARVVAEELIAREPWERAHVDRFRRALAMSGEAAPDDVIAARLGGEAPFVTVDPVSSDADESGDTRGADGPSANDGPGRAADPVADPQPEPPVPQDLDAVFAELRGRSSTRTSQDAKAQSLLTGALALLALGEVDEALTALESAARSPRLRFDAAVRAARIYRDRGQKQRAVDWFERAAETPPTTTEEGRRVLYELAELLESMGEPSRALALYMELYAQAGEFRDVASRMSRLAKAQAGH